VSTSIRYSNKTVTCALHLLSSAAIPQSPASRRFESNDPKDVQWHHDPCQQFVEPALWDASIASRCCTAGSWPTTSSGGCRRSRPDCENAIDPMFWTCRVRSRCGTCWTAAHRGVATIRPPAASCRLAEPQFLGLLFHEPARRTRWLNQPCPSRPRNSQRRNSAPTGCIAPGTQGGVEGKTTKSKRQFQISAGQNRIPPPESRGN
jgi:hypothetical protein